MVTFQINGASRTIDVDGDVPLLWVLRDELGLTGTKYGCGVAQCGACTVHIDGRAIRLLTEIPRPSDTDIDAAMSGNVCRCATYVRIRAAIHEASRTLGG